MASAEYVCAFEWNTCQCVGSVKYGYGSTWTDWREVDGSIECRNSVFGDPYHGQKKECVCQPSGVDTVDPSICAFSTGCEKCATVAFDLGLESIGDACWNRDCGDKWGTQCGCVHCEEEVYNYCNSSNSEANDVSEISSSDDFDYSGEEDLSSGEEESFSSSEKDDFSSEEKALEEESGYTDAIAGGVVGFLCLCAVFMWYGYVRTHPKEGLCPCCGGSKKSQGGGNMQMA